MTSVHARETVEFHYERTTDPRVSHTLTLRTDAYGNVLAAAAIAYGRRGDDPDLPAEDQERQRHTHVTCTETDHTRPVEEADAYRAPMPCDARTYELYGLSSPLPRHRLLSFAAVEAACAAAATAPEVPYENDLGTGVPVGAVRRRRIEHVRTLFRREDLDDGQGALPLGWTGPRALPHTTLKLALTPGLLAHVYLRDGQDLLPAPDRAAMLGTEGGYREEAGGWWLPSGRAFYSEDSLDTPAAELTAARSRFFLPTRFRDPFGHDSLVVYDDDALLVRRTRDPVGNVVTAENDYRVLKPHLVTDANGNRTEAVFDSLGLVAATAVMGKATESLGDSTAGLTLDPTDGQVADYLRDPLADPHTLLAGATTRLVYDLFAYHRTRASARPAPPVVATLSRETHTSALATGEKTAVQHRLVYCDGFGREIQTKVRAEPDAAGAPQWVGSGWTVFNNKGNPVRRFEPFFSPRPGFEYEKTVGVSTILLYDPLQRVVATVHPDHTYDKVVFDAWQHTTWDVNDTVLRADPRFDPHVGALIARLPRDDVLPTWYTMRAGGGLGFREQAAAVKAAAHDGTPSRTDLDALGRVFRTVTRSAKNTAHVARQRLDMEGNVREVRDARGRSVMLYDYDLLGRRLRSASMEAGTRWTLPDATDRQLYGWDSRGHRVRTVHDAARRPVEVWLRDATGADALTDRTVYGEGQGAGAGVGANLRGKPYRIHDQAGVTTFTGYDFKGNLVASRRALATVYRTLPDWSANPPLEPEFAPATTAYDALNRPVAVTTPDGSTTVPGYNEAGLLETVTVSVRGAAPEPLVKDVAYNAKGQRTRVEYGNGAATDYTYDDWTFRLRRLHTLRGGTAYQDLSYTYDPAGNITAVRDDAQQTEFFRNVRVEPEAGFTYDALYRLTEATGREDLSLLTAGAVAPLTDHPGDRNLLGRYTESYVYDLAGNLDRLTHIGSDPAHPGWVRLFGHQEPSALDGSVHSNRLSWTRFESSTATEPYTYDAHGNITTMPHLPVMTWDHRDQLHSTASTVTAPDATPTTTYYVYDSAGTRVRKVTESPSGKRLHERVYLGGVELYRAYDPNGTTVTLERQTLHVMADTHRLALIESRTTGNDGSPAKLVRYQFGDHLDSATLELSDTGRVISYEEYHPYGTLAYRARGSRTDPPKRYGFTGMERDEESRLGYHGARYYAAWVGRWTACDPTGIADHPNLYVYCRNRPTTLADPEGMEGGAPTILEAAAHSARLLSAAETLRPHGTSPEPAPERTFMSRGGKVLVMGGILVIGGALTLLTGGLAAPAVAGAVMSIAAGGAGMALGATQLGLSYSGRLDARQDEQFTRASSLMMTVAGSQKGGHAAAFSLAVTKGDIETAELVGGLVDMAEATHGLGKALLGKSAEGAPSLLSRLLAKAGSSEHRMQVAIWELGFEETPDLFKFIASANWHYPTVRGYVTSTDLTGEPYELVMKRLDLANTKLAKDYAEGGVWVRFRTTYGNLELPPLGEMDPAGGYRTAWPALQGFTAGSHPVPEFKLVKPIHPPKQPTTWVVQPTPGK
ncbi:RHS repeat-associated core domain-containing protein [Streptomyces sp. NPDC005209]|uniref:RHS repeat-associated core domain-containing protein n=1 Tax=Streptomyces sp. NPDC005209 TaxID=3156715 RepID=UPI0033A4069A